MRLGATVPDFTAQTTHGPIRFYNWLGNSWCILFSHPADFTPVCTTELARMAERAYEFTKRGVRMIGHSCDSVAKHLVWLQDIRSFARNLPAEFPYPIIADETRELAVALDMLDESERTAEGEPVSVRAVLIIAPDRRLRLSMYYPNTTGRNVEWGTTCWWTRRAGPRYAAPCRAPPCRRTAWRRCRCHPAWPTCARPSSTTTPRPPPASSGTAEHRRVSHGLLTVSVHPRSPRKLPRHHWRISATDTAFVKSSDTL
ncbi:peroxiredoxin-6-like isoform X1 [Schistocerca gregaria]|uniref:peroxiredoxin-6-like isoform X1 n=1 Tax=Schistocerca gregaria TaxID=7010 RepID=UPI00211DCFE6|nr:peroxiredoxin-6-like isoform X1 [Schistocerca gregaria]